MNAVYLYNSNIPDLANDRFSSNSDYQEYLTNYGSPELLFEDLIYDRESVDRFIAFHTKSLTFLVLVMLSSLSSKQLNENPIKVIRAKYFIFLLIDVFLLFFIFINAIIRD